MAALLAPTTTQGPPALALLGGLILETSIYAHQVRMRTGIVLAAGVLDSAS